jgi:hypothetical protein
MHWAVFFGSRFTASDVQSGMHSCLGESRLGLAHFCPFLMSENPKTPPAVKPNR